MNSALPLFAMTTNLTGLDWLVIALYFCILGGVAWWVVRHGKDTAADYFLAGRNLGWWVIGASIFASNIGSEHIVGLAGSGATDGVAMAHYELHAWCLLVLAWVFVPFYMRSQVFTMPEFLERRFSEASRYVLSIVSLITFIVSKIAVGIFAGGVVFGTLLPELAAEPRPDPPRRFWIGSILVIVLTGLYTALGGMRAVAYNDAVQVIVLITGSALLTFYGLNVLGGWGELRRICGSDMFNLWKPLIPAGRRGHLGPGAREERRRAGEPHGLVLQRPLPVARHALLRPDHRPVVLVHRPVHRPARARRPEPDDRPPRQHLRRLPQALPGLPLHHPGPHLLRPGEERQGPRPRAPDRTRRQGDLLRGPGCLPDDGAVPAARRACAASSSPGCSPPSWGRSPASSTPARPSSPWTSTESGSPRPPSTSSSAPAGSPPPSWW